MDPLAFMQPEEARKRINSWVAAATNNLVDSILPRKSVHGGTSLVVTTAIYFKGIWETTFDKSLTKKGKFHLLDGTAVDAQFMRSKEDQFIAEHDEFKVLVMPYAAAATGTAGTTAVVPSAVPSPPQYSMCVLLPNARDGLPSLVDKMTYPSFLQEHMPERSVEVGDFRVPKFKISFYSGMKRQLQDLGIKALFDPARADLPDILVHDGRAPPLVLEDVFHRAVIEVNEEGTEAAASTALIFAKTCAMPAPSRRPKAVDFVADHPFAFFVVEEVSGAILFAGQVLDPTKP
jgi:serpin B